MANILINAVSAKIGGGKNILDNFIQQLSQMELLHHTYYILTPNYHNYKHYTKKRLIVIDIAGFYKKNVFLIFLYFMKYNFLLQEYKINLIFNFGDILIPCKITQIYFFDWAYAVYSDKYIWNRMSLKSYIVRKIKILLIRKYINYPKLIIVQTRNMKERLQSQFDVRNVVIIPTPIAIDFQKNKNTQKFNLPEDRRKYLYPANYMPHKNFDIIIPLAEKIQRMELPFTIILTIDENIANKFMQKIKNISCIINVGKVEGLLMPSLYQQCDAVIFPSLLESYGLPYVEAMAYEKPILTSDLDFAHDMCGEIAYYFNPFDVDSILSEMQNVFSNKQECLEHIKKGRLKIQYLPNWGNVIKQFQQKIDMTLNT
jgi:glycosyltransferase involved in cell wall biosynthesis